MKLLVFVFVMSLCQQAFTKDMSGVESNEYPYDETEDGTEIYIGACSTHEDYVQVNFSVTKTLVSRFYPNRLTEWQIKRTLVNVEPELMEAAFVPDDWYDDESLEYDHLQEYESITLEKIQHLTKPGLDLYRFAVEGSVFELQYLIFNRIQKGAKISYELMSKVVDGGVLYCDEKVWNMPKQHGN